MNSLNKAQVIGNITRDPELKTTNSGQSVCTVGVATNRYWTDSSGQKKDEVEFHNIVVWGKLAEICDQYLRKGMKVFFDGRLQTRSWEDEGGAKHYRTEIVAQDMIMLTPKSGTEDKDYTDSPSDNSAGDKAPAPNNEEDLPF